MLVISSAWTLEDLEAFMKQHGDTEKYNEFEVGKPAPASVEKYVLLPATPRFAVAAYTRAAGGLFSKENKVILTTVQTEKGAAEMFLRGIPTGNVLAGVAQTGSVMSTEKERKGPAEEVLLKYTEYMKSLLKEAGYLK